MTSLDKILDSNLQINKRCDAPRSKSKRFTQSNSKRTARSKKNLPDNIKFNSLFCDALSSEKTFILKEERLFISKECRSFFKNQLHKARLGYASVMRRARDTIFG